MDANIGRHSLLHAACPRAACVRQLSLALGLLMTLLMSFDVFAQPASFRNGLLSLPAVALPGGGQIAAQLRQQGNGFSFAVERIDAAAGGADAPATFAVDTLVLRVPAISVDGLGSRYAADLLLVSTDTPLVFQVMSVSELVGENPNAPRAGQDEYDNMCALCHGPTGTGTPLGTSLVGCAACADEARLAEYIERNMPISAVGPDACVGACAERIARYVLAAFNGASLNHAASALNGVVVKDWPATLRKASLNLLGRLPTAAEREQVVAQGEAGMRAVLAAMMDEDAFYERLMEIYNDVLLTDKYLSVNRSEGAIELLSRSDFPERRWFDPGRENRPEDYYELRRETNDAIAREVLQLIAYVVKNDRPFTEVLTADYTVINPYSARSYGINGVAWNDPNDPNEFRPGRIDGVPHAGLLTSAMFLNRFPTTRTNRNRHRARKVFEFFLDTDILAIDGSRPQDAVDITSATPTLDNPSCYSCHNVMDPVASAFQNWDDKGRYRPSRLEGGWYSDMEPRGFAGTIMPLRGNVDSSLQWLAAQMVQDPRFARATVRTIFRGLTGSDPLSAPGGEANADAAQLNAYLAQRNVLSGIERKFAQSDWNLKTVVTEVVLSPYFRANALQAGADAALHRDTGSMRLLTPEMLHRKIGAVFGFEWKRRLDYAHEDRDSDRYAKLLNKRDYYQQLYGGIDSDEVSKRLTEPNGLMAAVQERMAAELSCYAVPHDFTAPRAQRRLFPHVAVNTTPLDGDGFEIPSSVEAIKRNIQHLHGHLLGENRGLSDPEIEASYQLFLETYLHGQRALGADHDKHRLPRECQRRYDFVTGEDLRDEDTDRRAIDDPDYLMRAWMSVVAYLLSDSRFLYE